MKGKRGMGRMRQLGDDERGEEGERKGEGRKE